MRLGAVLFLCGCATSSSNQSQRSPSETYSHFCRIRAELRPLVFNNGASSKRLVVDGPMDSSPLRRKGGMKLVMVDDSKVVYESAFLAILLANVHGLVDREPCNEDWLVVLRRDSAHPWAVAAESPVPTTVSSLMRSESATASWTQSALGTAYESFAQSRSLGMPIAHPDDELVVKLSEAWPHEPRLAQRSSEGRTTHWCVDVSDFTVLATAGSLVLVKARHLESWLPVFNAAGAAPPGLIGFETIALLKVSEAGESDVVAAIPY